MHAAPQAERDAIEIEDEGRVEEYLALTQQLARLRREMRRVVCAPKHALPFLQPGRLVRVLPPAEPAAQQAEQKGGWVGGWTGDASCGWEEGAGCWRRW